MLLIDTHCHINLDVFDSDRGEVILRAKQVGVQKMICIGCHVREAEKTLKITEAYENVFAAVSLHPCDIREETFIIDFEKISAFSAKKKVVAIGETGLDLFRPENPALALQQESFWKHFELAKKVKKPLIIHSRAAKEETLEMLKSFDGYPFVWHCFSEDMACAEQVFALGGMISFTGVVTFPGRNVPRHVPTEIQNVAKNAPLDRIMVETDSPFLAPIPHRGKRCEPAFVADTARFIAELRDLSEEEFAAATTKNAVRLFGL